MVIASNKQQGLIGYNTTPDYQADRKPEQALYAELYSLRESSLQGHFSDKATSHLCSGTITSQSGRDRKAPLRKEVLHLESHPVLGNCNLNSRVLHVSSAKELKCVCLGSYRGRIFCITVFSYRRFFCLFHSHRFEILLLFGLFILYTWKMLCMS